ncbi:MULTISPECIES: class F sortase [unclassified Nocardioides]|uniref:class F sortase n=1 Tax=unclassified Nocardioides TaxID=2615069 RepID=UPI0009E7772B|nr:MULTISPECIES: class F sortase [unclassified Nocardioides]
MSRDRVSPPAAVVLVAGLLLVLLGCATGGAREGHRADPSTHPDARSVDTGAARRAGPPDPERPVSVRLPSGIWVPVAAAGVGNGGVLGVPEDVDRAGWWRGGARLGDPFGATLIAGHVDSTDQGLGAFAELLGVRPGQQVRVRSKHLEQVFTIRSRRLVPGRELRDVPQVFSVRGERRLTLVTCAPPYEPSRGGYQNLAVVTATPVGDAERRRR